MRPRKTPAMAPIAAAMPIDCHGLARTNSLVDSSNAPRWRRAAARFSSTLARIARASSPLTAPRDFRSCSVSAITALKSATSLSLAASMDWVISRSFRVGTSVRGSPNREPPFSITPAMKPTSASSPSAPAQQQSDEDPGDRGDSHRHADRLPRILVHVLVARAHRVAAFFERRVLQLPQALPRGLQVLLDAGAHGARLVATVGGDRPEQLLGVRDHRVEVRDQLFGGIGSGSRHALLLYAIVSKVSCSLGSTCEASRPAASARTPRARERCRAPSARAGSIPGPPTAGRARTSAGATGRSRPRAFRRNSGAGASTAGPRETTRSGLPSTPSGPVRAR